MRVQHEKAIAYIKEHYKNHRFDSFHSKKFGHLEVLVWYNAFKIYYHETCIVSYSDISKDVHFDNWWWESTSTAENMKAFVEEIFDYKWLPRWKGIDTWNWEPVHEWKGWVIYIQPVNYLYL